MSDEDDIILWQDVLDLVRGGRPSGIVCPFCKAGTIKIEKRERVTRLQCPMCRKYIEGSFPDEVE